MKLYYVPGTCSLASHIVSKEIGLDIQMDKVDFESKDTESGENLRALNSKGYVPMLKLDDGSMLTEGVAILQYLADQAPESGVAPKAGTMERYRLQEWLTFISTEIHKGLVPLFNPHIAEADRGFVVDKVKMRFGYAQDAVKDGGFLMGDTFTVADAYILVLLRWTDMLKVDISDQPDLVAYRERLEARPAVQAALKAEGLLG